MRQFLQSGHIGNIVIVRMPSPETCNALTERDQMQEFLDLCADLKRDATVRVMVLTGTGKAFCAGGNIKDMQREGGRVRLMSYQITTVMAFKRYPCRCMSLIYRSSRY